MARRLGHLDLHVRRADRRYDLVANPRTRRCRRRRSRWSCALLGAADRAWTCHRGASQAGPEALRYRGAQPQIVGRGQTGLPERLSSNAGRDPVGPPSDILVRRSDGSEYGINVGRQSPRTGAPVRREAEAINDLEGAGLEMHFVPYP